MDDEKRKELKEVLFKEIDLIQACITRMAQNSFVCKGWVLTLTAALLALSKDELPHCVTGIVMIYFSICFWGLDAFFLQQEKKYRGKYNWVIKNRMTDERFMFDLNPNNEIMTDTKEKIKFLNVMFSKTLLPMYLVILALSVIYTVVSIIGLI